ncbi:MAG: ASCH domain-containing protein [Candidatus Dadabacteria bacterium]
MNILHLTIKRQYFLEILEGLKKEEYREDKEYWAERLEGKEKSFTHILFKNGYNTDAPEMLVECKGIQLEIWKYKDIHEEFVWVIKLGKILRKKHIMPYRKPVVPEKQEEPVERVLFEEVKEQYMEQFI